MAKLYNLAGMSTATTGTGTITLGSAMYGHLTFAQAGVADGDLVGYAVKDGAASEVGYGVYTASGTTLSRTVRKSTNSDAAISLSGSAEVFITPAAEDFLPVSSGAALGLLANPFFEISQEFGQTLQTSLPAVTYIADQMNCAGFGSALVCSGQNISDPFSGVAGFRRLLNAQRLIVTTAEASPTAAFAAQQPVEGSFIKSLAWGTADARAVDLVAILSSSVAGTYSASIRNGANDRAYVKTFALAANTPTVVLLRFPGDTAGTWATGTSVGMRVRIGGVQPSGAGSEDAWHAAGYTGSVSDVIWTATLGADVTVAYLQVFPAGVLPWSSASEITGEALQQLLNIRRPYDDELRRCQRYWEQSTILTANAVAADAPLASVFWAADKRTTPTISATFDSGSGGTFAALGTKGAYQNAAHSGQNTATITASARM